MASECLLYTKHYSESWDDALIKTKAVPSKAGETDWAEGRMGTR